MGRYDLAFQELGLYPIRRLRKVRHAQYCPSRTSKCVGLSRHRPPVLTQCAVQRSMRSKDVGGSSKTSQSFLGSLSSAVSLSHPINSGITPSSFPNCSAILRTLSFAGAVRLYISA